MLNHRFSSLRMRAETQSLEIGALPTLRVTIPAMANPGHREGAPQHTGCYPRSSDTSMRIATISFIAVCGVAFAAEKPEWDNPAIVHIGTEKPHGTMMVYPSAE